MGTPQRTNDDDIELKSTLQELVLDLLGDGVETDVGRGADFFNCDGGHLQQGVFSKERKSNESKIVDNKKRKLQLECGVACLPLHSGSPTSDTP